MFLIRMIVLLIVSLVVSVSLAAADKSLAATEPAPQARLVEVEREITWDQLPAKVQVTIRKEAAEHEIVEIEEVRIGDTLFYEADWLSDGMEVEVKVAPDGKLLSREVEEPDDEDGDEDDDDDDDNQDNQDNQDNDD